MRQALPFVCLLLIAPLHGAPPCQGRQGEELYACCTKALYEIQAQTDRQMQNLFSKRSKPFVAGDRSYMGLVHECVEKKAVLFMWQCASIADKLEEGSYCTIAPFTQERELRRRGLLPEPPTAPAEKAKECREQRFLLWTRNRTDYLAGHGHKWASITCALWEAYRLNRTLVLDSFVGMDKTHGCTANDAEAPFSVWYSTRAFGGLPKGGMLFNEFAEGCGAPGVYDEAVGDIAVLPSGASHADMLAHQNTPLLVRQWDGEDAREPAFANGFNVCNRHGGTGGGSGVHHSSESREPEPGVDYRIPKELRVDRYANWVYSTASQVLETLKRAEEQGGTTVVCVHVRRGDKIEEENFRAKYPKLSYDTSAVGIMRSVEPFVQHGSTLYLATTEPDPATLFRPLESYFRVWSLAQLGNSTGIVDSSKFITSTLALVDYVILRKCPRLVPTFHSEESRGFLIHLSLSSYVK